MGLCEPSRQTASLPKPRYLWCSTRALATTSPADRSCCQHHRGMTLVSLSASWTTTQPLLEVQRSMRCCGGPSSRSLRQSKRLAARERSIEVVGDKPTIRGPRYIGGLARLALYLACATALSILAWNIDYLSWSRCHPCFPWQAAAWVLSGCGSPASHLESGLGSGYAWEG